MLIYGLHLPFQRQQTIAGALAFWMANSSELLNFLKQDRDLSPLTQQSQLDLSHLVHKAYRYRLHRQPHAYSQRTRTSTPALVDFNMRFYSYFVNMILI